VDIFNGVYETVPNSAIYSDERWPNVLPGHVGTSLLFNARLMSASVSLLSIEQAMKPLICSSLPVRRLFQRAHAMSELARNAGSWSRGMGWLSGTFHRSCASCSGEARLMKKMKPAFSLMPIL
jgi:hypothetical protein